MQQPITRADLLDLVEDALAARDPLTFICESCRAAVADRCDKCAADEAQARLYRRVKAALLGAITDEKVPAALAGLMRGTR